MITRKMISEISLVMIPQIISDMISEIFRLPLPLLLLLLLLHFLLICGDQGDKAEQELELEGENLGKQEEEECTNLI